MLKRTFIPSSQKNIWARSFLHRHTAGMKTPNYWDQGKEDETETLAWALDLIVLFISMCIGA